ncbi:hypothetical protein F5887DRAFT_920986 [Amanita rubescens]|nr:hypothetical protein F5887DRAFT_1080788 [Amanita rubescens]KAF8336002.1 hypothetical protein F5887DRAFT_920986 [Amanita rubescens]
MPPPSRIVSTICSKRLKPSDCIDISGISQPTLTLPCGRTRLGYPKINATSRFPPNTRGFFYYHTPPKAPPPLVGELRFRCASNLDDFHNGKDLVLKDKFTPWSIPLYAVANLVSYAKWREQLMLDNLLTQATLDKWVTAKNVGRDAVKLEVGRGRPVLYYITQPFVLRFNAGTISFYTATKDEIGVCYAHSPLKDTRSNKYALPYGGSGLVRLEPLVNPKRPEQGQLAIRVLKIIEPVKALVENYDGYLHQPTEGVLVQRSNMALPVPARRLYQAVATLPLNFDDLP